MGNRQNYYFNIGDFYILGDVTYYIRDRRLVEKDKKWYREYLCECGSCNDKAWKKEKSIKRMLAHPDLSKGKGCRKCNMRKRAKSGKNDISTTHPWLIRYFVNPEDAKKYSAGSGQYGNFKCPECGARKSITFHQFVRDNGISCPICGRHISYPNRFAYSVLSYLGIEFSSEYSDDWSQGKRYDFYFFIDNKKYLLEMDGALHFESAFNKSLVDIRENDRLKEELAEKNGFIIIRVDCRRSEFEYIKKNFIKAITDVLPLDSIDWSKINEMICSNFFYDVCNYYKNNPDQSFDFIGRKFGISGFTVRKYIYKGIDMGLCNYVTTLEQCSKDREIIVEYAKNNPESDISAISKSLGIKDYTVRKHIKNAYKNGEISNERTYYELKRERTLKIIKNNADKTKKDLCHLANCSHAYLNKCLAVLENDG